MKKRCSRCEQTKPVEEFGHRAGGDGYQGWCRACFADHARQRRAAAGLRTRGTGQGWPQGQTKVRCPLCGSRIAAYVRYAHLQEVHDLSRDAANAVTFPGMTGIPCPVPGCAAVLNATWPASRAAHYRARHPGYETTGDGT